MSNTCIVGDPDSHGGTITSGAARTTLGGIPVAHIGSTVSPDPIPGHSGKTIVSSATSGRTTVGGIPVAADGAGVSCGATISASASRTQIG